jgi:peptide/nickel transport system permease protein
MGVVRHLAKRALFLAITFVLAIYATVVIANGGGVIDKLLRDQIQFELRQRFANDQAYHRLTPAEQQRIFNDTFNATIEARGLNEPFLEKSFRYTLDALQFKLGKAINLKASDNSRDVGAIIFERLPRTLVLFTAANIVAAVFGIWLGLWMARKALTSFDRGMTVLSVTTFIVPPWVYGILFILLFGFTWKIFPTGGWVSTPPPPQGPLTDSLPPVAALGMLFGGLFFNSYARSKYHRIGYAVMLGGVAVGIAWLLMPYDYYKDIEWHMVLPAIAVAFSIFGSWSYTTRNLVLQVMDEDFVFAARAKGLRERDVLNKYVLRSASPPIVTSLALTLVAAWTGAIITETVFNYPGLGQLFFVAISNFDAPVVVGLTTIYALLLVLTVFGLDLTYSLLDPRIKAMRR